MQNTVYKDTYLVGGSIRDELLGLEPQDKDYVMVGFTEQEMLDLGFKKRGKSFPVFIGYNGCEYALARSELSTGNGYNDFLVDTQNITIEQDLARRDLTINAMARSIKTNEFIDPFNGKSDLQKKILRHVSEAFAEDPIRVLRIARLKARLGVHWKIAPETRLLINSMTEQLKALQPDRAYKEVEKAMNEKNSYLFFLTLDELQVLDIIFPSIGALKTYREASIWHLEPNVFEHTMSMLYLADNQPIHIKFMILYHDIAKPLCRKLYGNGSGHDSKILAEPLIDIKLPKEIKHKVLMHIELHQRIFKTNNELSIKKIYNLIVSLKRDINLLYDIIIVSKFDSQGSVSLVNKERQNFSSLIESAKAIFKYSPKEWLDSQESFPSTQTIENHKRHIGYKIIKSYFNKG